MGTGWLYSQFATGVLGGYSYDAERTTSAGQLQRAIWWLEQENFSGTGNPVQYNPANPFMFAAFNHFGSENAARANGAAAYDVYALNLTTGNGGFRQDVLFYRVPEGGASLMLLGGAFMALAGLRRRFRS